MRKRYIQVEDELLGEYASDLSVHLDCNELEAIGHTNLLFSWLINRCPKDRPPSASAVHEGPLIEKLIARACKYAGDPKVFIDAFCSVRPAVLERLPGGAPGVRGKGLDRYDGLWAKNYPVAAKAWRAAHPEWKPKTRETDDEDEPGGDRTVPERFPTGNRGESSPLDPDPDPDRDVERDSPPPPPRAPPKLVVVGKKKPIISPEKLTHDQQARWEFIQTARGRFGLLRELEVPAAFPRWSDELDAAGSTRVQEDHALALYLRDDHFRARCWPTAVLITDGVWGQRYPPPPPAGVA